MYGKLAGWFPLFTSPSHYKKEAGIYKNILLKHKPKIKTVLELGSGGGHNAYHLKKNFQMTLSDISQNMLDVSKKINPGLTHIKGDMRTMRLNKKFDAVFIQDAVSYMTTKADLEKALQTAYVHLKDGGAILVMPDYFKETFKPSVNLGEFKDGKKEIKYIEWIEKYKNNLLRANYSFLIKDAKGKIKYVNETHILGLFSKKEWFDILKKTGFKPRIIKAPYNKDGYKNLEIIYGVKNNG